MTDNNNVSYRHDPGDPPDEEQPCAMCGADCAVCDCPECPVCTVVGDPNCYVKHGMKLTVKQATLKWECQCFKRRAT